MFVYPRRSCAESASKATLMTVNLHKIGRIGRRSEALHSDCAFVRFQVPTVLLHLPSAHRCTRGFVRLELSQHVWWEALDALTTLTTCSHAVVHEHDP